jgi:hypothetical protein
MLSNAKAPLRWGDDPLGDLGGNNDAAIAFHQLDLNSGSDAHRHSHHASSSSSSGSSNGSCGANGAIVALQKVSSPPGLQGKVDALQHGLSRRYRPDLHHQEESNNQLAVVPYSPKPAVPSSSSSSAYGAATSYANKIGTAESSRKSATQSWQSATSTKPVKSNPAGGKASVAPRASALQAALKGHSTFAEPVPSHTVVE